MNDQAITLLSAVVANGSGSPIVWGGGEGQFTAFGSFGGGTVTLEWSPNNGTTWLPVDRSGDTYVTFTANGSGRFTLQPCLIRANLAGATSPNVNAIVYGNRAA